MQRVTMAIRVLILSVLIFAAAFGAHEVMHLLVIYAVGGQGSIIVLTALTVRLLSALDGRRIPD